MKKIILTLLLSVSCAPSAFAGELGDLFAEYQAVVKEGDAQAVLPKAQAVYGYAVANLPEQSKSRAAASMNYGKALFAAGQKDDAETQLKKALATYRSIYGEKAEEVIDPLMELARARADNRTHSANYRNRYKKYLHEALNIAEESRGKDSMFYAWMELEAGRIALDSRGDRRALRYLESAYQAFSDSENKNTFNYFLSSFYLGKFHMARKHHERAKPYLEAALAIADIEDAPDSQFELTARAFLVEIYEETGEPEKSVAQCRAIGEAVPFEMNQEPRPLFSRMPEYPQSALHNGREGYAVVNFTISDSGIPTEISTLESVGSTSFGNAAEEFVEKLRFAPRFVDGQAVDTPNRKFRVSFNFAK